MTAMMVFQSQLEAVESATPRARMGRGKISPMTIQAPGPHEQAKKTVIFCQQMIQKSRKMLDIQM